MNISCTRKIDVEEGLKVEFKSSLLFSPDNSQSHIQQEAIAKTICAFINTQGGTLYLGVNDSGYPVGLASDMRQLSTNPRRFTTKGAYANDVGYTYRPTVDQLYLKFQKIVEAYLGKMALQYILDYDKKEDGSNVYLVIPVKPATNGNFTYFINHHGKAEIWIRTPGATRILTDKDRDDFIVEKMKERYLPEKDKLLMSIHTQLSAMLSTWGTKQDDVGNLAHRAESLDCALKSLMTEVNSALFPQKNALEDCIEYYATFDRQTSSMVIMDEFEKLYNGRKIYGRMVLCREPALCSVPYRWEERDRCFHKIEGCDFGLNWVSLLVERCPVGNSLIDISYRESFSFSELKNKYVKQLHEYIWDAMTDLIKDAPVGGWHTVLFKQFLGLKAHNSSSQYLDVPPQYRIVGVRCSKYKLTGLDETAGLSPYAQSASNGCDEVKPYYIADSYNQLCNKYIAPYEQRVITPKEYREAKHRERVRAEAIKGKDADLDVLELPFELVSELIDAEINTVGCLAELTDESIEEAAKKSEEVAKKWENAAMTNPLLATLIRQTRSTTRKSLCVAIKDARQKAREFLCKRDPA